MNKAGTQRIETDRLILRRFRLEDAEDMYANWASDPEVARFLTWPTHSSVEVTKSLLADWIPDMKMADTLIGLWSIKKQEKLLVIFLL